MNIMKRTIHTCEKCGDIFEQFDDLTDHFKSIHTEDQCYSCEECESVFESLSSLEAHFNTHHENIPQLDGPLQDVPDLLPQDRVSTRTTTYTLNKNKQLKEITKDAMLVDFNVKVNNNDENCTIKCSSGFYLQVAKASFLTLDDSATFTVANVAFTIDNVKITNDETGFEANRLIRFMFFTKSDSCGSVTVHLHHSTRTIQVQGSAIMPDTNKAAFWFVSKVILKRFQDLAKAKQYAIKNFNNLVKDLKPTCNNLNSRSSSSNISDPPDSCQQCFSRFSAPSRPAVCTNCGKYFHKRNCLKEHMKGCRFQLHEAVTNNGTEPLKGDGVDNDKSGEDQSCINPKQAVSIPGLRTAAISFIPPPQSRSSASHSAAIPTTTLAPSTSTPTTTWTLPGRSCSNTLQTSISIPALRTAVTFVPTTSVVPATSADSTLISFRSQAASAPFRPSSSTPCLPQAVSSLTSDSALSTDPVSTALNPSLPRTTTKVSSRKSKNRTIPTSNEDITAEFLERELGAAQARIAQLEATVKDKE